MVTFNDLWQLLYNHGSSNAYQLACNNLWNELSPDRRKRQEAIIYWYCYKRLPPELSLFESERDFVQLNRGFIEV